LSSDDVELTIRQQPIEGLIALDGKEKLRKPIDPPPFIEMKVKQDADQNK
jgi:Velvet factor